MLTNNQTTQLKKLLQKQKGTLQQLQQQYFSIFKQAISLLNAAQHLSQLLQQHNIQLQQRIKSLYLLIISFNEVIPQYHPLIINILYISSITEYNIERVMIYQILIKRNKNKYSIWNIQDIIGYVQTTNNNNINNNNNNNNNNIDGQQIQQQQKQIKNLRIKVHDKYKLIQCNLPINALNDDVPQFLRLVPQYMPISTSQLNWLSPGIISDVQWDNSAQIDKKLQKCRKIFENALKRTLQQQQRTQLLNSIQSDPYSPLHIGFNVKDLNQLIIHNSYIAASLVIKLSKYPIFQQYLQQFLSLPTTAPLLDATARIIKQIRVPQAYVQLFCSHHMNKMIKAKQNTNGQNYKGLAYTMTAFLQCMFQNSIINPLKIANQLKCFITQFNNIIDFGPIKVLLEQTSDLRWH